MPAGEAAAGLMAILGRLVGYFSLEIFLEQVVKGPAYLILARISKAGYENMGPDNALLIAARAFFWIIAVIFAYGIHLAITQGETVSP